MLRKSKASKSVKRQETVKLVVLVAPPEIKGRRLPDPPPYNRVAKAA